MTLVDYASNFWGDKHIGYNVLYDNMKKGEESVGELLAFLKERISVEEEQFKSLGKSLHRVNGYVTNNGGFLDAWKLAKGTLELWTEVQSSMVRNLNELCKEVVRYQDELARMRKRAKDADTLETINLMQTTTTCLQKARETYSQRCAEVVNLKQVNKEWTVASTKEYIKARNKLNKAHEEYRQYLDKYGQVRDTFEERIVRAARAFQEHDRLHLLQMKRFFVQMAKYLEDGHGAQAQLSTDLRQKVERQFDVEEVMLRFVEEKGTGSEPPQKLRWTDADELPPELDAVSCIQSQSSSNSSAIVPNAGPPQQPTVNDLLGLDDTWITSSSATGLGANSSGSIGGGFGGSGGSGSLGASKGSGGDQKSAGGDSDSERHSEALFPASVSVSASMVPSVAALQPAQTAASSSASANSGASSSSYVPQQISSWLSQKKGAFRLKKHFSASQSSLPGATNAGGGTDAVTNDADHQQQPQSGGANQMTANFSKSYNESAASKGPSSLLKRYQKGKGAKSSVGDLTQIGKSQPELSLFSSTNLYNDQSSEQTICDPLQVFGPPPPLPTTEPPSLEDEMASAFGGASLAQTRRKGSCNTDVLAPTRHHSVSFASNASGGTEEHHHPQKPNWSTSDDESDSGSDDEDEAAIAAQRSKLRQIQIRPLNDSQQSKLNASVDELKTAISQISLQKSSTFDDPWSGRHTVKESSSSSSRPSSTIIGFAPPAGAVLRQALTGDEHLRRKNYDLDPSTVPFGDFTQSAAPFAAGSSIARARPRSHTPMLPPKLLSSTAVPSVGGGGSSSAIGTSLSVSSNKPDFVPPSAPRPIPTSPQSAALSHQPPIPSMGDPPPLSTAPSIAPHSFGTPSLSSFAFGASISSSPLTVASSTAHQPQQQHQQLHPSSSSSNVSQTSSINSERIPIAMAINEYLHAWIKQDKWAKPEVRLFGTVMFSLPSSSLAQLQQQQQFCTTASSPTSLLFMLQQAGKLKGIVPNKMFFDEQTESFATQECHQFTIESAKLVEFLRERVQSCPQATFHNADLLRYELPVELVPAPLPLTFSAHWTRLHTASADRLVELRIDIELSPTAVGSSALQNVAFNTKITTASGDCLGISLLRSEPPAKWIADQSVLSWEFRELTAASSPGHLRAMLKCLEQLTPANTYVQFQLPNASLSNAQLQLDDASTFALSVFKQKVLSGKYFCEPTVNSS